MKKLLSTFDFTALLILLFLASIFQTALSEHTDTYKSGELLLNVILNDNRQNFSVVVDGEIQPGWGLQDSNYSINYMVSSTPMYFYASERDFDTSDSTQRAINENLFLKSLAISTSPLSVCHPFFVLFDSPISFPLVIPIGDSNSIPIELRYNCSKAELVELNVTATISNSNSSSGPNQVLRWSFDKDNEFIRPELFFGTSSTVPDVVFEGQVLPDWSRESHSIIVSPGVLSTPFYIWTRFKEEYQTINRIDFVMQPEGICYPYVDGDFSTISHTPSLILVVYNCSGNGTITFRTAFVLEGGYDPIILEWVKISGGSREHLMVGTEPGASDVIWWGLTLPLWNDYNFELRSSVRESSFWFYIETSDKPNDQQKLEKPVILLNSTILDVQLSGDLVDGGIVTTTSYSTLNISYTCKIPGRTKILLSIPMRGFETISWKWTKNCGSNRDDFMIGTMPNYDDVVTYGHASLMYDPTWHTAFTFPDVISTSFYMSLSGDKLMINSERHQQQSGDSIDRHLELLDGNELNQYEYPLVIKRIWTESKYLSCSPFLSGNGSFAGTELQHGEILELTIIYNCTRPGNTKINVHLILEGPWNPIQFTWIKRVGKGRNGLTIGTSPNDDDVVIDGSPTPMWDPPIHSAFFGPWQEEVTFYARMVTGFAGQRVQNVTVSASSVSCIPLVEGAIVAGGVLTNNSISEITVRFQCIMAGKTTLTLAIHLEYWPVLEISMDVYVGGPRPFLDIGTMKWASDVVQGGTATPLWIPGPLNGASVDGNSHSSTFWLGMSSNRVQIISPPILTYQTKDEIFTPYLQGTIIDGGLVTENYDHNLTIFYNCSKLGSVQVSISFLLPPFDPVSFSWEKICSAGRSGFKIGTTQGDDDVCSDGEPSMAYNPLTHVAFTLGTELYTKFYMEETNGDQRITGFTINSSLPICSPFITQIDQEFLLKERESKQFTVVYNCSNNGETNILVTFYLDGFYLPVSFMWTKRVDGVRNGFNVGTTASGYDVVYNGSPTFSFDPIYHNTITDKPDKTFWMSVSSMPSVLPNQLVLPVLATSDSPWLVAEVSNTSSFTLYPDTSANFTIIHHCLAPSAGSESVANVITTLIPVPYSPVKTVYGVRCPKNQEGLKVVFDNGAGIDPVVQNGFPDPDWSPANVSRMVIDADFNQLQFYLSSTKGVIKLSRILIAEDGVVIHSIQAAETENHLSASFVPYPPPRSSIPAYPEGHIPACAVNLSGPIPNQMKIDAVPKLLLLGINCTIGGTNNISVILEIDNPTKRVSSTVWTFSKYMGGPRHGFTIQADADDFAPGTSISTVLNGLATPEWSLPDPKATASSKNMLVTSFSLSLTHVYAGRDPTQEFAAPSFNVTPPNHCYPQLFGNASSGGYLTPNSSLTLEFVPNCFKPTIYPVTFELDIGIPPFSPVAFGWNFLPSGTPPALSIDALLSIHSAPKPQRVPVVRNGMETNSWAKDDKWNGESIGFIIFMDKTGVSDEVINSGSVSLELEMPVITSKPANCQVLTRGNASLGEVTLTFDRFYYLEVDFKNCSILTTEVKVSILANPYYTPVRFDIHKEPSPPPKPKFPYALLGVVLGSTLLIAIAVSVGIYLCMRKPTQTPSTGGYHLRRRQQEREERQPLTMEDIGIN